MNAAIIDPPTSARHATLPESTALGSQGFIGIRRFTPADSRNLFVAAQESLRELRSWMVWCPEDYSLDDSENFASGCDAHWDRGDSYSFVIYDLRDGTFLGSAGLNQINRIHNCANLGYWVRQSHTSRGIASAAAQLVAFYGLRTLGFRRIEIVVPAGNWPSRRVAEKIGAKFEGLLRHRLMLRGESSDAFLYSLIQDDLGLQQRTASA